MYLTIVTLMIGACAGEQSTQQTDSGQQTETTQAAFMGGWRQIDDENFVCLGANGKTATGDHIEEVQHASKEFTWKQNTNGFEVSSKYYDGAYALALSAGTLPDEPSDDQLIVTCPAGSDECTQLTFGRDPSLPCFDPGNPVGGWSGENNYDAKDKLYVCFASNGLAASSDNPKVDLNNSATWNNEGQWFFADSTEMVTWRVNATDKNLVLRSLQPKDDYEIRTWELTRDPSVDCSALACDGSGCINP